MSTPSDTKNLWTQYNGKGFSAKHAEYAERASTDVMGHDLTLTMANNQVTAIGGKLISAVPPAEMTGATASTDGDSGLVPAPAAGDEEKLLTGDGNWTAFENDVVGTRLLDELGQPVLDETTQEPIYDAGSTDQLWTGFAGKGFGAIRAYADQDGHNIKATYVKKAELNEPDEAPESDIDHMFSPYGSVEIGGRSYRTITIGNQEWLADNLDYQFECDGAPLPINPEGVQTTPAAWYYNRESDYGIDSTYKCGLLYNWYATHYLKEHEDTLLPAGWQVASEVHWETLLRYLVDPIPYATYPCSAGMKVADSSIADIWPDGWNGTNEYNFNIVPGGYYDGMFRKLGSAVYEWTINRVNDSVTMISFTTSDNVIITGPSSQMADEFRKYGYYVRLVKPLA